MKRKMILWGMCLCLAVSLSACGKKNTEAPIVVENSQISESEDAETQEVESKEETLEHTQADASQQRFEKLTYSFADAKAGADFLLGNKDYLNNLTHNDLCFRMQKKDVSLEEYTAFAAKQTLDFTEEEKAGITACMQKIEDICEKRHYKLPAMEEITFVKTTMQEESGAAAYTHGTQIYMGEDVVSFLSSKDEWERDYGTMILAHELFHCLTRSDSRFREDMYGIIGFRVQDEEFTFAPEIKEKILSNPDVGKHNSYATFRIDGRDRDCVVVFSTTRPFEKPGDSMFDLHMVGLVPIDDLSVMYPAKDAENFWEVFGRNTEYVLDPEEVLADNFSYAIMYGEDGMDCPSPEIIKAICDYLKK